MEFGNDQTRPGKTTIGTGVLVLAGLLLLGGAAAAQEGQAALALTCFDETSTADFMAGTYSGTMVSEADSSAGGGSVRLLAPVSDLFLDPVLSSLWEIRRPSGGYTPMIQDGIIDIQERDDEVFELSSIQTVTTYGAGSVFEARAKILPGSAFVSLGFFDDTYNADQWAYFSTRGSGSTAFPVIYTSVRDTSGSMVNRPTGVTMEQWHDFKVVWHADSLDFYVDDVLVDSRSGISIETPQKGGFLKSANSASAFPVDWTRITPYAGTPGIFESQVMDAGGAAADWQNLMWQGSEPVGTSVTMETRTGETATPDGTWTAWEPVAGTFVVSAPGRYAQYRTTLTTGDLGDTPVVDGVDFCYFVLDITPPQVTATLPLDGAIDVGVGTAVTATFDETLDPATVTDTAFTLTPQGGSALPATVMWDSVSSTATLVPTTSLDHATLFEARLTTAIADPDGNALALDHVWTFTTEPPDLTSPTVTAMVPADGAVDILAGRPVRATFSEAVDPATLTGASFTLTPDGGAAVAAAVSWDPETFTAFLTPADTLDWNTAFEARLTTAVTDVAGNPLVADEVWTFTTRPVAPFCIVAATTADFGAGFLSGTMVSEVDSSAAGGQIRLKAPLFDTFEGSSLDPQWVATRPDGYVPVVANGLLDVQQREGATESVSSIESQQVFGIGTVLEARAMFVPGSQFIDVGFDANTINNSQYAWFSSAGTGHLPGQEIITARVRDYAHNTVAIDVEATYNEWHIFKIIWTTGRIEFYVDGILKATHTDVVFSAPMRAAFYKSNDSDSPYWIDWIRVTPYDASPGTYESPVADARTPAAPWASLDWMGSSPAGTSVSFETRTGETATPDGGWSAWSAPADAYITSPPGRYAQYRSVLTSDDLQKSPVIDEIALCYDAPTDATPPAVVETLPADGAVYVAADAPVSAAFNKALDPATLTTASFTLTPEGGSAVTATVSYDPVGFTATLVPDVPLDYVTNYTGHLAATIADTVGNLLPAIHEWTFTTAAEPDLVPPLVLATAPLDGAIAVPADTMVTASFNEPMDPATVTAATFTLVPDGGSAVPATVALDPAGTLATLVPDTLLAYETLYTAQLATAMTDTSGNGLATEFVWSFTTDVAPPDLTAPTVLATTPPADAVDVAIDAGPTATFDEPMDQATLTTASFTLTPDGGAAVPATVSFDPSGTVATLVPDTLLAHETLYTAELATTLADTSGNTLAAAHVWNFTTVAAPDTTAPTVLATAPVDAAIDAPADGPVTATFDEPMDPATLTPASFALVPDGGAAVTATLVLDPAGTLATLTPDVPLDHETLYAATLSTALTDTSGNALAADHIWSFTTAVAPPDTFGPTVLNTVPADAATDVAVDAIVTAAFDEPLDPATITGAEFTLIPDGGSAVAATISYNPVGSLATLTPDAPLALETVYTAHLATAITDILGNPLAAEYLWSFTTVAPPDILAPTVLATVPTADALDVSVTSTISAAFDEAMDPATLTAATFTLTPSGGAAVSATLAYDPVLFTATLTPDAPLDFGLLHEARLTTGVTDASGNELVADHVWSFTTETADLDAPYVAGWEPTPGAAEVLVATPVRATFNEALDPATLTASSFTLTPQGGSAVPAQVSYDGVTFTATLIPTAELDYATSYDVRVTTAVTDLAGNPLVGDETWTFTTRLVAPLCSITTTTGDFAAGLPTGVMVSEYNNGVTGGQMRLQAAQSDLFLVPTLDPEWQITRPSGGFTPDIVDGILDGQERNDGIFETSAMHMATTYAAGATCEYRAMIQPGSAFSSIGFLSSSSSLQQWAFFSTRGTGGNTTPVIYTSLRGSDSVIVDNPTTITLDQWHDFKVVWSPGTVDFYVDGALVDSRTSVDFSLPQRLGYYKSAGSDSSLLIDWVRITPYTGAAGSYESVVQDAGEAGATWTELVWLGTAPAGTSVAYETRTGETVAPDGSWSAWEALANDTVVSPAGRYAQFRAALATADVTTSPVVDAVQFCYETAPVDTVAPTVLATLPVADAVDVAIDAPLTATFDEVLDPATLTAASFTLTPDGGSPVAATVSLDTGGTVATLVPDVALDYLTLYTAQLTTAVADTAGNGLATDYIWSFTTVQAPDTDAPTVLATLPATDAVDAAIGAPVTATFDEVLDPATLTTASFTLTPDGGSAVTATVSLDTTGTVASLVPDVALDYLTLYTAQLTTAVADTAGNGLAADYIWSFTTVQAPDTDAPTVVASMPDTNAVDVAIDSPVTATFDEVMDPATLTAASFTLTPDGGSAVAATVSLDTTGTVASLVPDVTLDYLTLYTAQLTTAVADTAGNGLATDHVWSFTTVQAPDTSGPVVLAVFPVADMIAAPSDTSITATFDEPVDPATLTAASFTLSPLGGDPVAATVSWDGAANRAVLLPGHQLDGLTVYEARLTIAITDTLGNALAADHVWTFTTVDGPVSGVGETMIPRVTALMQNAPNPFNPRTKIAFDLSKTGGVRLKIYSVDGKLVKTLVSERMDAGRHSRIWDGTDNGGRTVPTGVYLMRLETPGTTQTRKMLMLK